MKKNRLLAASALALMFGASGALAQSDNGQQGPDPNGYYSQSDHDGYYDRDGHYVRYNDQRDQNDDQDQNDDADGPPPDEAGPPPQDTRVDRDYSRYEEDCRRGNNAAGTIFGAIAGGLIGSAASHGNGGAVVGGAILGGLLGNAVTRDMPCDDHPYAFHVYAEGLDGHLHHRYWWRHGPDYGYFVPQREFYRGRTVCRSWTETTWVHGRSYTHSGTACRREGGNWRFDD